MSNVKWNDNTIQFPRLLAEIVATQDSIDFDALAETMDLEISEVIEILDRAVIEWEAIKQQI